MSSLQCIQASLRILRRCFYLHKNVIFNGLGQFLASSEDNRIHGITDYNTAEKSTLHNLKKLDFIYQSNNTLQLICTFVEELQLDPTKSSTSLYIFLLNSLEISP
jgi:hypothetical protein